MHNIGGGSPRTYPPHTDSIYTSHAINITAHYQTTFIHSFILIIHSNINKTR